MCADRCIVSDVVDIQIIGIENCDNVSRVGIDEVEVVGEKVDVCKDSEIVLANGHSLQVGHFQFYILRVVADDGNAFFVEEHEHDRIVNL